jgi:hypothetical protein
VAPPPGPPTYAAGPPPGPGPGPIVPSKECACLGDDNQFLGFIGDDEEKDTFISIGSN